jgi:DNA polymerase delta subunit 2
MSRVTVKERSSLITRQHWIAAPPPREKYISSNGLDEIMLEDESGRLRLTGELLQSTTTLVTGCIIAALGTENANGVFEVIESKVADLPRQPQRWERDEADNAVAGRKIKQEKPKGGKIAIISGLEIAGDEGDSLMLDLLLEYLLGESVNGPAKEQAANISRLIIAGSSVSGTAPILPREEISIKKANKKYGYDASSYNPQPTEHFDTFLSTLLPSVPVTLLPGLNDPTSVAIPQQPLHPALFPRSRAYTNPPDDNTSSPNWFDSVTNPWEGDIDGWRFLGTGGQPVDDIFKYVEGDDRLSMMENLLRWRCNAPTAPDTLCTVPLA